MRLLLNSTSMTRTFRSRVREETGRVCNRLGFPDAGGHPRRRQHLPRLHVYLREEEDDAHEGAANRGRRAARVHLHRNVVFQVKGGPSGGQAGQGDDPVHGLHRPHNHRGGGVVGGIRLASGWLAVGARCDGGDVHLAALLLRALPRSRNRR